MHTPFDLSGRIAIVTGASRTNGIGAGIAMKLARCGADVVITGWTPYDRDVTQLAGNDPQRILADIQATNVRGLAIETDLSQPHAITGIFDQAEAELGTVSILVNNACYSTRDDWRTLTAETLDAHYAVNVRATAMMSSEFGRRLSGTRGTIVNMTSGQGLAPMQDEMSYAITKGAIETLTQNYAAGMASHNITVNAIDPGVTDTGWVSDEHREEWTDLAPMGRYSTPDDTARLVAFLASDEGRWITGQVIHSRGGF